MSKLTREQKIEIYYKHKEGKSYNSLVKEYGISSHRVEYLIRLIDRHGIDILRNGKNRVYSKELKLEIINKVLVDNQSIRATAIEYGLSSKGMLDNWIRSYKENGCDIIERKKGRKPTMKKIKPLDPNDKDAIIKAKDQRILELEAENDYLKKLRAVVQARKNQQSKKK